MCCKELIDALGAKKQANCFSENKNVAKENDSKFTVINQGSPRKTICRVSVDDCLLRTKTKKCDYLFKVCETNKYLLVELKGSDVKSAFPQIKSTFDYIKDKLKVLPTQCEGFIVSHNVPKGANREINRLKEQYLKNYQLRIRVKNKRDSLEV